MKLIERGEVLGIADYERVRDQFRARVIAEKKKRRVALGPKASAMFENRDTVLLQIQEMLRTERITREAAIQHEIDTYNALIPGENQLSCTVMIEIPDTTERDEFLLKAVGFEKHVSLVIGGEFFRAVWEKERESPDKATAVHYLRFTLTEMGAGMLRRAARPEATVTQVELTVGHEAYEHRTILPVDVIVSLGKDLAD